MNYKKLKQLFIDKKVLNIKLFNKEYIIEGNSDYVSIYPIDEVYHIQKYKTFDELMKKYNIYNVPLKEYIHMIIIE